MKHQDCDLAEDAVCVVTGGAGFIGSHLVEGLLQRKLRVRVVDNFSTGRLDNLRSVAGRVDIRHVDIRDLRALEKAVDGAAIIFHQAALPSVARSLTDPVSTAMVNTIGMLNILLAARRWRVRRVVYASSSSVYGDTPVIPKHESMAPGPVSPYGASKVSAEAYALAFSRSFGLETIGLRYFNVFGPRQDCRSQYAAVIPKFITRLLRGEPPAIFGDGLQTRDFTYVENVVHANLLAMCAPSPAVGRVFNIGTGERISVRELFEAICDCVGMRVEPEFLEGRAGEIKDSQADISRAREVLGYEPVVGFREGLAVTVEWHRRQGRP